VIAVGYYKIVFGKVEKEINIEELSTSLFPSALLNTTDEDYKKKQQREYDNGNAILYNAKKIDSHLFLYIAVKKDRTSRKIDWERYNIEKEKFEDMTSSNVILYEDGLIFIESNNKFPIVLRKLNELVGHIKPYVPTEKVMKRFYEEAEAINYMKLINVGKTEPNPHPRDAETEKIVKDLPNTKVLSAYSTRQGNLKEDKLIDALETYSTPIELTGKKKIDDDTKKFSISGKKKKNDGGTFEIFYSITIKKPKEESPEKFDSISEFVREVISSI